MLNCHKVRCREKLSSKITVFTLWVLNYKSCRCNFHWCSNFHWCWRNNIYVWCTSWSFFFGASLGWTISKLIKDNIVINNKHVFHKYTNWILTWEYFCFILKVGPIFDFSNNKLPPTCCFLCDTINSSYLTFSLWE